MEYLLEEKPAVTTLVVPNGKACNYIRDQFEAYCWKTEDLGSATAFHFWSLETLDIEHVKEAVDFLIDSGYTRKE